MASCGGGNHKNDEEPDYGHLTSAEWRGADAGEPSSTFAAASVAAASEASEYILGTLVVRVAAAKYLMGEDGISIGRLLWSAGGSGRGGVSNNKKAKKPPSRRGVCPYARLAFGGNAQRTTACYNSTEPEWSREEQYYFDVTLPVPKLAHLSGDGDDEAKSQGKSSASVASNGPTIFDQRPDDVAAGERQKSEGWSSIPSPPRPVLNISLFHSELGKEEKAKKAMSKDKGGWSEEEDFCLGTVSLDVTQVLTGKVRNFDRWIPLGGGDDVTGEVRIICEYDAADPPPRHGDLCRFTGFCNPADLYPAPASIAYRVDELDGDDVILSYTSPEGWLCTFKAHRYQVICAVRHQAAIKRYEAEVIEIVQKLAQSPMVSVVQETAERLEDDGLINVGRDALMGGVGLLSRWLDGGVELAVQDVVHATNWDGRHSAAIDGDDDSSEADSDSADNVAEREAYEKEDADAAEPLPGMPSCPITGLPMRDPVVAADGHSYERKAIMRWFKKSNMSPITREELPHKHVVPNYMLLSALQKENNSEEGVASSEGNSSRNINENQDGSSSNNSRNGEEGPGENELDSAAVDRLSLT